MKGGKEGEGEEEKNRCVQGDNYDGYGDEHERRRDAEGESMKNSMNESRSGEAV
jgi:hypothetical protein